MDPISALSIASGIVAFVDFGAKLVSLYSEIRTSHDGRPAALSTLETDSHELSRNATEAKDRCDLAEEQLRKLVNSVTASGGSRGLRANVAASIRGLLKQSEINGLEQRLGNIRSQVMIALIMCVCDDVAHLRERSDNAYNGRLLEDLENFKVMATSTPDDFSTRTLWSSLRTIDHIGALPVSGSPQDLPNEMRDQAISANILRDLEYAEMSARESQINDPFPETFQWLLGDGDSEARQPTGFKEWLETEDSGKTPFWITGKPASGKSTLMKYICTNPRVKTHLLRWSGEFPLLMCSAYFWNPGSLVQKRQKGLLRTMLHQLLRQRPDLSRVVAPRHYLYYQLTGTEAPPVAWPIKLLQESVAKFVSHTRDTHRLAIFVDGLDEFDGDLDEFVLYLKKLQDGNNIKLCVSSRPWNIFKDAFRAYPSLRMEQLTKPDIERYVRTRMADSVALQELRAFDSASVERLETETIDKAQGIFLWVVLVVEKVIATARDNNDLGEIWKEFEKLPPGLEELYGLMLERLDPFLRKRASVMHQILRLWVDHCDQNIDAALFWVALNCRDPRESQHFPKGEETIKILPLLERQLTGATGGMLQMVRVQSDARPNEADVVQYIHRTVYDWLMGNWTLILQDGPADYDASLSIASALVSGISARVYEQFGSIEDVIEDLMVVGRHCIDSPESRAALRDIFRRTEAGELTVAWKRELSKEPNLREPVGYTKQIYLAYLALRYACAPYIQAEVEAKDGESELLTPRRLLHMPLFLWDAGQRRKLKWLLVVALDCMDDLYWINMKLKCLETLIQADFAPRRHLLKRIQDMIRQGFGPRAYYQALVDGLEGRGYGPLTAIQDDRTP
ncbi:hypothetical protein B0H66DRAFT_608860 [Apodospora peruviana]|uniref:Nephrocystin 3-like N-terminal domain-containing protein n=1 Tax=Apodospora peruviana TaxID=516989 RepID=A0AAE0HSB2_9PEZI|nr:hypothetical protein B0H66DRAFT_608860 [Apodospora peruviana]